MQTDKPFDLNVGDAVRTKFAVMGNPVGAVGIVFEDYGTGAQIIFPNGEYCGWGLDEYDMLEKIDLPRRIPKHDMYEFRNVGQVTRDFAYGYWSWMQIYAQFQHNNPANPVKSNAIEKLKELLTDEGAMSMQNPGKYALGRLRKINRVVEGMIETLEKVQRAKTVTAKDLHEMQESDRHEERFINEQEVESE